MGSHMPRSKVRGRDRPKSKVRGRDRPRSKVRVEICLNIWLGVEA